MTREELWARLAAGGVVHGSMPDGAAEATPWYVAAMVGTAAWIASLFMLAFLGIAFSGLLRHDKGAVAVGVILCAVCATVLRTRNVNLFVQQIAVAASLAGQGLVAFGILGGHWRSPEAWLAFAVAEIAMVAAAPLPIHRVLATLAAACAIRFALAHAGLGVLFAPFVAGAFVLAWIDARRGTRNDTLWRPVMTGLALAALLIVPAALAEVFAWQVRAKPLGGEVLSWVATVGLAAILLVAIAGLLREEGASLRSNAGMIALAAGAAVALAARPLPGLVVALVVLLVAFAEGRRALMGVAVAGMLGALGYYYYAMEATLLAKAAALCATGVVLLVTAVALRMGLAQPEPRHA